MCSLSCTSPPSSTCSSTLRSAMVSVTEAVLSHIRPLSPMTISYGTTEARVGSRGHFGSSSLGVSCCPMKRCQPTYRLHRFREQSMTSPPLSSPKPSAFPVAGSTHSSSGSISRFASDTRAKTRVPTCHQPSRHRDDDNLGPSQALYRWSLTLRLGLLRFVAPSKARASS